MHLTTLLPAGAALALALAAGACGNTRASTTSTASTTGTTSTTGGGGNAATTTSTTGSGSGGSTSTTTTSTTSTSTTGSGGSGGGAACSPAPGSAVVPMDCDLLQIAVLEHTGGASDLRLTGRLFGESAPMPACAAVDGVDILAGGVGSTVVQHLAGGQDVVINGEEALLADGAAPVADISGRCASDDPAQRFNVYGVVVTGRVDGGTFVANCALAEGGSRWPPALRVTCHKNVDLPADDGDVTVMSGSVMGMSFATTQLSADAPHAAGGALQTLDGTLHVIPLRSFDDPGQPIPSQDVPGWMTDVTESASPSAPASQMSFFAASNLLGSDLCPPAPSGPPGPNTISPPVFLARATGNGGHGAFSTEIFVTECLAEAVP